MIALRKMKYENEPMHVAVRMAEAIMERMAQKGECRIAHLRAMNFSLDDIARYWPNAWKIVEERMPRPGRR
jgi:hypothetical protein